MTTPHGIKLNKFYILKNSNSIDDAIEVYNVAHGCVFYKYYYGENQTKRYLPHEVFVKCYKEYEVLNVLYGERV